ncbi:PREDICTED: cytoplasmic dynein 2 light intermediate chain 1-like [Priapulus caudatus]|uniref:Cytoplasmic dynein 2 light intermediate chain 1 n=1 Tax=Priapulus caudatus TaxID=37621 RepID=A0ABM1F502_PRICU|nr:PREDICTED: cytoplasmic dynein 2 light intermediate chain 1-like [Priapulus caudatus]
MSNAPSNKEDDSTSNIEEGTLLLLGSQNSGKTSIGLRLSERDEQAKPTTALEYTYSRLSRGAKLTRDVLHIWELGGGTSLTKLLEVPINPSTLFSLSIGIVIDLSQPEVMWVTLETLLQALNLRLDQVFKEIGSSNTDLTNMLKRQAMKRIGDDHRDIDMLNPFPVPLVIIGSKYDIFQDKFDSEKRKVICKTLRFLAHINGAALHFCSTKIDGLMQRTRALLAMSAFPATLSKQNDSKEKKVLLDHNKPVIVPFGMDSMEMIGSPLLPAGDISQVTARTPLELWKNSYTSFFPQQSSAAPLRQEDPTSDPQYSEPTIDAVRRQRDEELERYRRLAEQRAEDAAKKGLQAHVQA